MKKLFILAILLCQVSVHAQLIGEFRSQYEYAVDKFRSGSFASAIDYCTRIIDNALIDKPRKVEAYKLRAMAYRAVGDYTKSAFDYGEAIQWGKREVPMFISIAQVYMCQKNFARADEALNEALRLLSQEPGTRKNFYILEEVGRYYHYTGNYKKAALYLKQAVDNGSNMAGIDLASALFRSNEFADLRSYTDTLLLQHARTGYGLLTDSSLYYYIRGLNHLAREKEPQLLLADLDRAQAFYRSPDSRCFQGYYSDLLAARAYIHAAIGNDTATYYLYQKIYAINNAQPDVKAKITELRARLRFDILPPSVLINNPKLDENNLVVLSNVSTYEMYGQAFDSSGVASLMINKTPVKVEDDGLFVFKLDLQPGKNEVEITVTDKYDNTTTNTFLINNVSATEAVPDDLNSIAELTSVATYHAVLIAGNDYQDPAFNDLEHPAAQVKELRDILVKYYEFRDTNVMVVINGTKSDIIDSLEKKIGTLKENDNLLIYYAGHGKIRRIGSNIEGGYLIPADGKKDKWLSYLSSYDLKSTLKEADARHILFVVDACFAGALLSRATLDGAPPGIRKSYEYPSRKMLTSGNLEEVPDNGKFFQNFRNFLLQNQQKYTTAQDLATFVMSNKETSNPQYERIPDMPRESGGQFVFIRK